MKTLPIVILLSIFFWSYKNGKAENMVSDNYTTYYVDSNSGDDNNDGVSKNTAWRSLKNLDARKFLPGDSILFARDSDFEGGFVIISSGTPENPIVFSSYGSGKPSAFTNPSYHVLTGNVIQVKGKHVTIDSLYFHQCANADGTTVDEEILMVGAVHIYPGADYLTVQRCEFEDCPIGVNCKSRHSLITNNYFHDCNRFLSKPNWGPLGILLTDAYSEISYNTCVNYVNVGGTFGADGGFLELDERFFGGKIHDVKIHHNKSFGNLGFLEIEPKTEGNIDVYYNLSDDYQQFIFYWGGNNSKVQNNTIIRTKPSQNGAVNTVFVMKKENFIIRNNIFVVANGLQVLASTVDNVGSYDKVVHENNLYYCSDGSTSDPCGKPLGKGEKIADPLFIDITKNNYHLNSISPARDSGRDLGYVVDLDNNPIDDFPDIGAYEIQK